MRFYKRRIVEREGNTHILIRIDKGAMGSLEIEIPCELDAALEDMQREFWRLEKREQRRTVHLDAIPECYLPKACFVEGPDTALIAKEIAQGVRDAFSELPIKQQRRLTLRYIYDLPIKEIASIEGCSERSIKYSLKLGKKNMRDILGENYLKA